MFKALVVGVFFLFLVWERRRSRKAAAQVQDLQSGLSQTQRQLEKAQQRTQQLVSLLSELHEYKVSPSGKASWTDLADFTVQTVIPLVGVSVAALAQLDVPSGDFLCVAARGLSPQQVDALKVRSGEGILGRAVQTGGVLVVNDTPTGQTPLPQEAFLTPPYLVLPLWVHSRVNGLLILCRPEDSRWSSSQVHVATLMAKQLQLLMENLTLYETHQRVYGDVVNMLAQALSAKDINSQHHAEHSGVLVKAMAREMHLPSVLTEQLEYGALLHDVGKLGVDEALLMKPGPLTAEEYAVVKTHSEIGYQILHGVSFLKGVAPIVRYHHEWVNGLGYPEGLAGEEIPLGARMVAIVEAWDAMTTDQPYRKALSKNNAIAELRQQAGAQFDPKLVDVFLHVVDQLDRAEAKAVSTPS